MNKKAFRPKDKTPAFLKGNRSNKPDDSVGPFTVVVNVFGPKLDAFGQDSGHVDPKNAVRMTLHDDRLSREGGSVQGALNKMRSYHTENSKEKNGSLRAKKVPDAMPFYTIVSVVDHGKAALVGLVSHTVDPVQEVFEGYGGQTEEEIVADIGMSGFLNVEAMLSVEGAH